MSTKYDHRERDALIRLLQRRDAERQLGLVWERDEIEADAAGAPGGAGYAGWLRGASDFIVSLRQRATPGGIALLEIKGDQLWGKPSEVDKATAVPCDYGAVFMVGRCRGERDFQHLRPLQGWLETDGGFSVDRLRHT